MSQLSFAKRLYAMGAICDMKVSDFMVEMYTVALEPYGWERVNKALDELFSEMVQGSKFPVVNTIRQRMGAAEITDASKARDAAARIVEAVSSVGYTNPDKAKTKIGEIGWYVVERQGGWAEVCNSLTYDNKAQLQAQWRDLAIAAIEKQRHGILDSPPQFKQLEGTDSKYLREALDIAQGKTKEIRESPRETDPR